MKAKEYNYIPILKRILTEPNPFVAIGLTAESPEQELILAYKRLKRIVHPDCFQDQYRKELAQQAFVRLGQIFDDLKDPIRCLMLREQFQYSSADSLATESIQEDTILPSEQAFDHSDSEVLVSEPPPPINWAEHFFNKGQTFAHEKHWDLAILAYQKALQVEPEIAKYHTQLGWVYIQNGQLGDAQSALCKALRLEPDQPLAQEYMQEIQRLAETKRAAILDTRSWGPTHLNSGQILLKPYAYSEEQVDVTLRLNTGQEFTLRELALNEQSQAARLKQNLQIQANLKDRSRQDYPFGCAYS